MTLQGLPAIPARLKGAVADIRGLTDRPIVFSPAHWDRQLSAHGIEQQALGALAGLERPAGELPTVTRARLVDYASTLDLDDARERRDAFLAVMVWGGGPPRRRGRRGGDPRTPWRIAAALTSTRRGDPSAILRDSVEAVREGDLERAYLEATRLHRVSGSFATKWLWLVGAIETVPMRPLVWDSIIVAWLGQNCPALASRRRFPSGSREDASRYVSYVASLHAWAAELRLGDGPTEGGARLEAYIFDRQQSGWATH